MKNDNIFILRDEMSKEITNEIAGAPILKSIVDAMPIAMNIWNQDMVNLVCNQYVLDIFNIEDGREYLENFYRFSPQFQPNGKSSEEMSKINFEKVMAEGEYVFNWMHQTLDGEEVPSKISLKKLDAGEDVFLVGFVQDLRADFSSSKSYEYDYYFRDKIPQSVLLEEMSMLSDEWFFSMDIRTGNFHYYGKIWPEGYGDISALTPEKIFEFGFIHESDRSDYMEMIENLKHGKDNSYDIRFITDQGFYRYYKIVCKILSDNEGKPVFAVGKCSDIHEQKVFEELSQKDLLTDCYNKISAENIIEERLKISQNGIHAFFIIDIDNFKGINDNLGHYFGDEVLREISAGLKSAFREVDMIARIGGDEFVVFVENISDMSIIEKKANRILEIYANTYSGDYKDYSISGSVGIALYPQDGMSYNELYQNADKALSQAKLLGKNRYIIYSEDLNIGTTRSITKIENANRIASSYFDYDLISEAFNILYDRNGESSAIELTLRYLCQKYNADRSYIFETLDNGLTYDNTFEWCKEGISAEIDNLQGLPSEIFGDFIEKAHDGIIYSNNLRETFEIDAAFETMANQGILSFVHAQIKREGEMTFFLGLDDCTKTRVWSEREINSLQYIAKILSIILQGTRSREKIDQLSESNKNSAHILDSSENIVYVSDIDSYDLLYLNKTAIMAVGNPTEEEWKNKKCYEILQGKSAPCDFCTNHLLEEGEYYEWSFFNPILGRTYLLKDKLIPMNGKLARLEIATDVSKITTLEKELQERLNDEQFLTNCVEMLHTGNEPDVSIYKLLEAVRDYYDAERSYIFELSKCGDYISNTFELCKDGCESFKDSMQNLPIRNLEYLFSNCEERGVFYLSKNDENLYGSTLEYALMKEQNLSELIVSSIKLEDKEVTGFVGVDNPKLNKEKTSIIRSVAKFTANFLDQTEMWNKLNQLSYYDILTGIRNRHSYNNALRLINVKHIESLGVAYIDVLKLSAINDSKGIAYGDKVLQRLANMLSEVFGECVFRVGGDEFIVLKENIKESHFENSIEELKHKLSLEKDFRASIGYTWNRNFSVNKSEKLDTVKAGEKYSRILSDNLEMEILDGKYVVYLQPQINLAENKMESAEALVRRIGARNSLQPPITFLPFYEKEGIIPKIDTFVLETICRTLKSWKDMGYDPVSSVSVNCSRMTISNSKVVEEFSQICDKYGVPRSKIVIEITETINGINENVLSKIVNKFTEAGFLISLDDFGSGYSNLTSLVVSDFDEIKIDMKLISDIHINDKSKALTEVAITLCNKLNEVVSVAEGVEANEQFDILREMGCNKGQGYYFDKPMTIEEFYNKYVLSPQDSSLTTI